MKTELLNLNLNLLNHVWEACEFLIELTGKAESITDYVRIEGLNRETLESLIYYHTGYHDLSQLVEVLSKEGYF